MPTTFIPTPPHLLEARHWLLYRHHHYSRRLRQARTIQERSYLRAELARIREQLKTSTPQKLAA